MSQAKRKPLFNRKETQSLLNTLKLVTTTGALSLTIAGWSLLAHIEANGIRGETGQDVALVAARPNDTTSILVARSSQVQAANNWPATKLNVVQWVQDVAGNRVAVVQDKRGTLWYVMGSDVPRLEQGLSPQVRPQPVRTTTRTRAS